METDLSSDDSSLAGIVGSFLWCLCGVVSACRGVNFNFEFTPRQKLAKGGNRFPYDTKNKNRNAMQSKLGGKANKSFVEMNNQTDNDSTKQSLTLSSSLFDSTVEMKLKRETGNMPQRPCLPTDYNTAKLKYKATKARASTRESTARVASESTAVTGKQPGDTPHRVESSLKALGLVRPLDNKTFEFGLAEGIKLHLVENIKLCGLKKGREKSLLDMISTLSNHLANRELEIERWVEFADKIALTSAEKLDQIMHEHRAICCSKDDALNAAHSALVHVGKEVMNVKKETCKTRSEVWGMLTTFPSLLCDVEKLRRQVQCYFSNVRSKCKSEVCRELEKRTSSHNAEKRRLESVIDRLEISIRVEGEKVKSLQSQLIDNSALLETQKKEHSFAVAKMKEDEQKIRDDLQRANEQIRSLELLVEIERTQKSRELRDKDEKMKAELDTIDQKVKRTMKSLVESKNKAIEEAQKLKAQLERCSKISPK